MSSSTQSSSTSTPSIVDTKETQKPIKDINYNLINAMSHILESLIKENVQYTIDHNQAVLVSIKLKLTLV